MNLLDQIQARLEIAHLSQSLRTAQLNMSQNTIPPATSGSAIRYTIDGVPATHAEYKADLQRREISNQATAYSPKKGKGSEIFEKAKQLNAARAASKPSPSPAQAMPTAKEIAFAIIEAQAVNAAAALVKTRTAFNAMTPAKRMEFSKAGGRIS